MTKNILITGGAGFVVSQLCLHLKKINPTWQITAFDSLKRRGSELNIPRLTTAGIEFIHGDIRNPEDLIFDTTFDILIDCSAEPSVLAGYNQPPTYLINTNLIGTINCLEVARTHNAGFIFLSTSRVYPFGPLKKITTIEKETRLEWPSTSPGIGLDFTTRGAKTLYGATKYAGEQIIAEYIDMYNLKAVITRFGVIAGPWQFGKVDQGVFTHWVLSHIRNKPLSYIGYGGTGKQVRDLLHVEDLCRLISIQINDITKLSGETFVAGGGRDVSLSLRETTAICEKLTGNSLNIQPVLEERPGDVPIYLSDNTYLTNTTGWKPQKSAEDILTDIYNWVCEYEDQLP